MTQNTPDTPANPHISVENPERWLLAEIQRFELKLKKKSDQFKAGGSTDDRRRDMQPVKVREWIYYTSVAVSAIMLITYLILTAAFAGTTTVAGFQFALFPLYWVPAAILIYSSVTTVQVDQVGGVTFLDLPVLQVGVGPVLVIPGIHKLGTEPASLVTAEVPAEQDKIFRGGDENTRPSGQIPPLFVVFREGEGKLPTDKQTAGDISGVIAMRLQKEHFFEFRKRVTPIDPTQRAQILNTMRSNEKASERMLELLRYNVDLFAKIAKEIAGNFSYNQVIEHLGLVNELLGVRLQYELLGTGVTVSNASITRLNLGHAFNEKIQERGGAVAERDAMITKAEGERALIAEKGKGEALALQSIIEARIEGLIASAKKCGLAGQQIFDFVRENIQNEIAQKFASGNNLILGADLDRVLGMVMRRFEGGKG